MEAQHFKIDWLFVAGFIVMGLLAITPAHAQFVTGNVGGFGSTGAAAGASSTAGATSGNDFSQVFQSAPYPTETTLKNVPNVAAIPPALAGLPSGSCIGVSKTRSAGVGAGWAGFGGSVAAGDGESFLDWGCEQERAIRVSAGVLTLPSLTDSEKREVAMTVMTIYRSMSPVLVAQGKADRPAYSQVMPKEQPAPAAKASAQPVRTAGVQQPTNCVADEYMARRMGTAVCK
jgi:hypothetical protein